MRPDDHLDPPRPAGCPRPPGATGGRRRAPCRPACPYRRRRSWRRRCRAAPGSGRPARRVLIADPGSGPRSAPPPRGPVGLDPEADLIGLGLGPTAPAIRSCTRAIPATHFCDRILRAGAVMQLRQSMLEPLDRVHGFPPRTVQTEGERKDDAPLELGLGPHVEMTERGGTPVGIRHEHHWLHHHPRPRRGDDAESGPENTWVRFSTCCTTLYAMTPTTMTARTNRGTRDYRVSCGTYRGHRAGFSRPSLSSRASLMRVGRAAGWVRRQPDWARSDRCPIQDRPRFARPAWSQPRQHPGSGRRRRRRTRLRSSPAG